MGYHGDHTPGKTVRFRFNTRTAAGAPATLAGTPSLACYKDGNTSQSTAGLSLSVDFDSVTGLHVVTVDTSADGTFYAAGADFSVVLAAGTVDSVSVVGVEVGSFSLANRSALRPTTADRTLDVSAGGEAGLDWANVGGPTTTVNLSGTTVKTATDVETDTQDIQSRLPAALVGGRIDANMGAVSGDTDAADALEAMLDGTGGAVLSLGGLEVVAENSTAAVHIEQAGTGAGVAVNNLAGSTGLSITGGTAGIFVQPNSTGNAVRLQGGTSSGSGLLLSGGAGSAGLRVVGGSAAPGIQAVGGSTSGDGISATGTGTGKALSDSIVSALWSYAHATVAALASTTFGRWLYDQITEVQASQGTLETAIGDAETAILNQIGTPAGGDVGAAIQGVDDRVSQVIDATTTDLPAQIEARTLLAGSYATLANQTRLLGLAQANWVWDDATYDDGGNLTEATIYAYSSAANATTHDKSTGLTGKYTFTATYSAGVLVEAKQVQVS